MEELGQLLMYLIAGMIEGLSDIFPIGGSAHIAIASEIGLFYGPSKFVSESFLASTALHLGSCIAIITYFWRYMPILFRSSYNSPHTSSGNSVGINIGNTIALKTVKTNTNIHITDITFKGMVLSFLVTAVIGFCLLQLGVSSIQNPYWIAQFLSLNAFIILLTSAMRPGGRSIGDLHNRHYIIIGILQGFGIISGLSRIGLTLCTALWCKLRWVEALKLSLILSIPTILSSSLIGFSDYVLNHMVETPFLVTSGLYLLSGMLGSAGATWVALHLFLNTALHTRRHLIGYGLYCFAVSAFMLLFFGLFHSIQP